VDLVNFASSDAATEGAKVVEESLHVPIEPWDKEWVLPEVARATLEALQAWQSAARAVLEFLPESTETTRELRRLLGKATSESVAPQSAAPPREHAGRY
jgi:hypothetical protein